MSAIYLILGICFIYIVLTIRGYKKGLLRMAVYFAGMIFIVISAKRLTPVMYDCLSNYTSIQTEIKEKIADSLIEKNSLRDNSITENQNETIKSYDLPEKVKTDLIVNNTKEMYSKLLVTLFEDYVAVHLANMVVKLMAFFIVAIVLWVAFRIVLLCTNIISKIPIIRGINKIAGAMLGFLEAYIIVGIITSLPFI